MGAVCFPIYWMLCLECSDGFFIEHSSTPPATAAVVFVQGGVDGPQLCPSIQSSPSPWRNPSLFQNMQNYSKSCQDWPLHFASQMGNKGPFHCSGFGKQLTGQWMGHSQNHRNKSNLPSNSTVPNNPNHKVPHPLVFSTLPEMVTAPLPCRACSKA